MPDQTATNYFLSSIVTFLSGGFVGALLNYFLSSARDRRARKNALEDAREARKREFLGFLGQWRSEVEDLPRMELPGAYAGKVHFFRGEAAKIQSDFSGNKRAQFDKLVAALSAVTSREAYRGGGRKKLTEAIDALVRFVECT